MTQTAQTKFEEARNKLSDALKRLEESALAKIQETSLSSQMLDAVEGDETSLRVRVLEQSAIIQKLNEEINKIQKNSSEIEKENDFFKDKNRFFADKIFKFKTQGSSLVQSVEQDLLRVKEIIKSQS